VGIDVEKARQVAEVVCKDGTGSVFQGGLRSFLFPFSLIQVATPQLENPDGRFFEQGRSDIDVTAILAYLLKHPQPQGFVR
jgi:hypothetical protein